MKRFLVYALVLLLAFSAMADETWYCVKCGTEVSSPFCPTCGGSREAAGLRDGEWICVCGKVNKGKFCGKCGTSREDAEKALRQETAAASTLKVGDHVTYGRYPQTAEGNDETPIEWLVLDVQGDKALLLSRYGLDTMPYNTEYEDVTWETCSLREWLNGDFLNRAFSAEEQKAIPVTDVDNGKGQGNSEWDTSGGNDTQDRVFLLSFAEACRYLGASLDHDNMKLRVAPTAYLLEKGVWIEDETKTDDGATAGWWWLRSPGSWQDNAVGVAPGGSFYDIYVIGDHIIRPACRVVIDALPETGRSAIREYTQELQAIRNANVGDHVMYGHYPQTAEGNDETPIEWLVLDVQGDKALLLSRYGLETMPYNTEHKDVTWETCTLRGWLNEDFLNRAFSTEEQKAIRTTDVDNSESRGYSGWSTDGGNDTQDKVFLLSCAEANRYLDVTSENWNNMKSRVAPMAYVVKKGTWTIDGNKTADGAAAGWWWLRSPGYAQSDAELVGTEGALYFSNVHSDNFVVRPAFWIDLGS